MKQLKETRKLIESTWKSKEWEEEEETDFHITEGGDAYHAF